MNGVLLVDKPAGMTSHDVVNRIRKVAHLRRVGHTGTLDPAATGLLVLCLGRATRLVEFLTRADKTYEGILRLGIETDSYDLDGTILRKQTVPELTRENIQEICNHFIGEIIQYPPMVSAVKVKGERLYKIARRGEQVERPPRRVYIHDFTVQEYEPPDASFVLRCGSGVYARALCHDVGKLVGCGGVLAALRRTRVGIHQVDDAVKLEHLNEPDDVKRYLLKPSQVLDMPIAMVSNRAEKQVLSGCMIRREHLVDPSPIQEGWIQLVNESQDLLAMAEVHDGGQSIQPRKVIMLPS